jgi:hypothetical protein
MKKLMIALASVASLAFVSKADITTQGTSFEGLSTNEAFNVSWDDAGGSSGLKYWSGTTAGTVYAFANVGETAYAGSRPAAAPGANLQALNLDTEGARLYRNINAGDDPEAVDVTANTVLFDSVVQFTASSEDPTPESGDKLIVWLKGDDEGGPTNLIVTAGYLSNGSSVASNYVAAINGITDFANADGWHRLTIKALPVSGSLGFVVFVDGTNVTCSADKGFGDISSNGAASFWNSDDALFPSLVAAGATGAQSLTSVGFAGTGKLDDVYFTSTVPDFAQESASATISWDEGVASVTYQFGEGTPAVAPNGTPILMEGSSITINVTYNTADGYEAGTWAVNGAVLDSGTTYTVATGASATFTINAVQKAFSVGGTTYPTLADAITAAGGGTVTLVGNVREVIADNSEGGDNFTLDLAGKSIIADGSQEDVAVITVNGTMTIIDSVGGGVVTNTAESGDFAGVSLQVFGSATIGSAVDQGATFAGTVQPEEGSTFTVIRGKFGQDVSTYVDSGSTQTGPTDGYYVVAPGAAPTYVAQIGAQGYETFAAALAAAADGDTITLLDDVTEAPFTIPVAKFEVQGLTIDLDGNTYTFDGGSGDGIYLLSSNKLTIANGTLAAAAGTAYRDLVRDYNSVLTLNNVTVDGANFPASDGAKLACLVCVEGGGANILGNTSIINVKPAAYAIKMGNHAQAWYEMGTTTVNTTGNIEGNVLIAGGVYNEVAVGSGSTISYYYGKNVHSTWEDGVSSANFEARIGTLPTAAGTQDNVSGQLFKSLSAAVAAANAGDTVTVLKDCTVATSVSFTKNITVSNDYTIAANVNYALCIGATVTFEGSGMIQRGSTITGSAFCVGANENTRGAITVGTAGTLNFNGGTVCGGSGGNLIKLENGTVNMNGGVLRDGKRGIKADADVGNYTSAIVINGGLITNNTDCAIMASAASANGTATVVVNGGVIAGALVYDGTAGTHSITIPGTSTAKFNADQSAFCASGYETTLSDGWYVVTAIPPSGFDGGASGATFSIPAETQATIAPVLETLGKELADVADTASGMTYAQAYALGLLNTTTGDVDDLNATIEVVGDKVKVSLDTTVGSAYTVTLKVYEKASLTAAWPVSPTQTYALGSATETNGFTPVSDEAGFYKVEVVITDK